MIGRIAAPPEARVIASAVYLRTDPFARPLPVTSETKLARPTAPLKKKREVRVIAIVMGTRPHALLGLENGVTQIVGIGDTIDGTRIAKIAAETVVLVDGRALHLAERSQ